MTPDHRQTSVEIGAEIGTESESLRALKRLVGWARGDHICKRCNGAGELTDPNGDDYLACPACGGEGEDDLP